MAEFGNEYQEEDTLKDKYLTFDLGKNNYAVALYYVTEILHMMKIIPMPDTPDYVRGIISLRGDAIPVIDLRMKLGLDAAEYDDRTCIVIVSSDGFKLGLIVDTASEVKMIAENEVEPLDAEGAAYIKGKAQDGGFVLDILKILEEDDPGADAQAN